MNVCDYCAQVVTLPCGSQGETVGCKNAALGREPKGVGGGAFPPLVNPNFRKVYIMGSLRNPLVKEIGQRIRVDLGYDVFDDWSAASPDADDAWKVYEEGRGRTYIEALNGYAAQQVFQFDLKHLNESTHGLLVLPAGRSAHMELGYLRGQGKRVVILLDGDYDRWDVMYNFADAVVTSINAAVRELRS